METFVVRVWRPAAGEATSVATPLTGVVEHIGTGRSDPFQGEPQLVELINAALRPHVDDVSAQTREGRAT